MRNTIWILVAAVVAFGGYVLFSGQSVQDVAEDASGAVSSVLSGDDAPAAD